MAAGPNEAHVACMREVEEVMASHFPNPKDNEESFASSLAVLEWLTARQILSVTRLPQAHGAAVDLTVQHLIHFLQNPDATLV